MSKISEALRKHVMDRGGPSHENSVWQLMLDAAEEIEVQEVALEEGQEIIYELRNGLWGKK